MQILQSFITSAIFAPFFFISTPVSSLATPDSISDEPYSWNFESDYKGTTPDCATPPIVLDSLPTDFWIQVIPLEPIESDPWLRPDLPLHIVRADNLYAGVLYDSVFVTQTYQARDGFRLNNNFLTNSEENQAFLWPTTTSYRSFEDSNPLLFDAIFNNEFLSEEDQEIITVDFTAVKSCTQDNQVELRLRGQRRFGDDKCE